MEYLDFPYNYYHLYTFETVSDLDVKPGTRDQGLHLFQSDELPQRPYWIYAKLQTGQGCQGCTQQNVIQGTQIVMNTRK